MTCLYLLLKENVNDEKIKSGVVVSGSGANNGGNICTSALALGAQSFSSPLPVSAKN